MVLQIASAGTSTVARARRSRLAGEQVLSACTAFADAFVGKPAPSRNAQTAGLTCSTRVQTRSVAGRARTAEEVHAMSLANLQGEYATVLSQEQLLAAGIGPGCR